ncbi:GNAT family N-acetyltransferase [Alkalibacter mobilis]|uniref:GNAT family N-acetyltransferase n=1 Tax=Alkalibacter mobilis TaxID=2787712 RepID=UPI00189E73E7|nr:GNAT family N-acetyltransferase [Alkalibacter mobilis]MBF7096471.1 GNAT family N-acetyltransferase [Alkalibacter mobilis]
MMVLLREYKDIDIVEMTDIWNAVVEDGIAFPQVESLSYSEAEEYFSDQTYCGVAEYRGDIAGLYILHPNNVGRCGHIGNTSYAVKENFRGKKIGRALVEDSIKRAKEFGFKILQFNAVVKTNYSAIHLYEDMGFKKLGMIPKGFLLKNGTYEDIILFYFEL